MVIQGIDVASLMTFLINEVACTMEYDWSNDFKHEDLKRYYDESQKVMSKIDFNKLTGEEMQFLGFRKWSDDSEGYLVPIWLLRVLPEGTRLVSIMGDAVVSGYDYINNDVRGGCTAYMLVQDK